MATITSIQSSANQIAYLAGILNCQVSECKYTNFDNQVVSLMVLKPKYTTLETYLSGAVNAYSIISTALKTNSDPNQNLFSTFLASNKIKEKFTRKFVINRVPYANYDQVISLGTGGQTIIITVIIAGLQYQSAWSNIIENIRAENQVGGNSLGTLQHPFYGQIKNVLPIEVSNEFNCDKSNCIVADITFYTSDLTHLDPSTQQKSLQQEIGYWLIAFESTALALAGEIQALKSISGNTIGGLL